MKRRKIKLRYKKERVLFCDVLPYELPFIFTNRYFYRFLVKNQIYIKDEKLVWNRNVSTGVLSIISFLFNQPIDVLKTKGFISLKGRAIKMLIRIPFTYKILHKPTKNRELAIIHPVNQMQMVDFYNRYHSLILYYTNIGRFSLRHPSKVASFFYFKDRLHHVLLGRKSDKLELFFNEYENLRTYFTYKQYSNIYKFYEDYRYQRAEKKFSHLLKFDIQSCFDSIYTHSIAWSTGGGRDLYKAHFISNDNTFASQWDGLMELMNYNETNGIVVGPEFSRLFAEVILQYVDKRVEADMLNGNGNYKFNKDYECYRYVDDYFLFFNDEEVKCRAMQLFANTLKEFKMSLSAEKTVLYNRPFITDITRAKIKIDELIDTALRYNDNKLEFNIKEHDGDFDEQDVVDDCKSIVEEQVNNALSDSGFLFFKPNDFNKRFKSILSDCKVESKDIVNYALARICRKLEIALKKFDKSFKPLCVSINDSELNYRRNDCRAAKIKRERNLCDFLLGLIDSLFFLYSGNKRVNTTLKVINVLNNIIVMLDNNYVVNKKNVPRFSDDIRNSVFKKIEDEISLVFQISNLDENAQIETLYFLITLRSLRTKYHIPANELQRYLGVKLNKDNEIISYPDINLLSIIILLYYFGNEKQYIGMKEDLMTHVIKKYNRVPADIRSISTEFTILTLDLFSCPYISDKHKLAVAKLMKITEQSMKDILLYFKEQKFMFTKWMGIDVTKELNAKISQEVYS